MLYKWGFIMKPNRVLFKGNMCKQRTAWHYIVSVIRLFSFIWLILFMIPIPKRSKHPMMQESHLLVMAHRGGADLAPENTMEAFHQAAQLGVDVIELDVHLTKDGHLVVIHDDTIDRTTDGTGRVNDLTLAEIQSYDAGYHFVDLQGNKSYRHKQVVIPKLETVFQEMPPNMRYTIELKETNDDTLYEEICNKVWRLMCTYHVKDKVLIGSFDQKILDMMTSLTNGEAIVSAGKQEVAKFVLLHKLGLHALYRTKVDSVELPIKAAGIYLMDKSLIDAAKRRGMAVHYWTINDKKTMNKLIHLDVDGIITNRPNVLIDLLKENKMRQ